MRGRTTDWLSAIGSIGTAVAALIAVVALVVTIRSNSAQREGAAATEIRRNLSTLAQHSEVLSRLLNDGSPLILAAAHIAKEIEQRLGPTAGPEAFWHRLQNDQPMMLSVAITGWNRSELSSRINDLLDSLRRVRVSFDGGLSMLRYPAELYDNIVNDAYSPIIFVRMFSEAPHLLLKNHRDEKSLPLLLSALSGELQSNASLYYVASYRAASIKIDAFIQLAARSLSRLDDDGLVHLSRGSASAAAKANTRTESMRILLKSMRSSLRDLEYNQLSSLIGEIEDAISKEGAREALKKLRKSSD